MEVINPFIRDNQQRMVMFLDELSVRLQRLPRCIVDAIFFNISRRKTAPLKLGAQINAILNC